MTRETWIEVVLVVLVLTLVKATEDSSLTETVLSEALSGLTALTLTMASEDLWPLPERPWTDSWSPARMVSIADKGLVGWSPAGGGTGSSVVSALREEDAELPRLRSLLPALTCPNVRRDGQQYVR